MCDHFGSDYKNRMITISDCLTFLNYVLIGISELVNPV
jgi:hypothetical protein